MPPDSRDRAYHITGLVPLLQTLAGSGIAISLDEDLTELVEKLRAGLDRDNVKCQGEMVISLKIVADINGALDVGLTSKLKLPTRTAPPKERLFVDADGNLTTQNPNRGTMFEGHDLGRRTSAN
ncbi:MAG: hypothetical protein WCF85_16835 [Rhodospirillaceae bacterium]